MAGELTSFQRRALARSKQQDAEPRHSVLALVLGKVPGTGNEPGEIAALSIACPVCRRLLGVYGITDSRTSGVTIFAPANGLAWLTQADGSYVCGAPRKRGGRLVTDDRPTPRASGLGVLQVVVHCPTRSCGQRRVLVSGNRIYEQLLEKERLAGIGSDAVESGDIVNS